jgi:hypothetical protein
MRSKLRYRSALTALLMLVLAVVPVRAAQATPAGPSILMLTVPCPGCNSFNALWVRAEQYLNEWRHRTPPGHPEGNYVRPGWQTRWDAWQGELVMEGSWQATSALVVSDAYPLSAIIRFDELRDGQPITRPVEAGNNLGSRDLDNRIFARSTKLDPIELSPGLTPADGSEGISPEISKVLMPQAIPAKLDFWHALTHLRELQLIKFAFQVNRPGHPGHGQQIWIFVGDTITVKYSNGYTEKWKLVNLASSIAWQRVEGTLRDANGNDPARPIAQVPALPPSEVVIAWTGVGQHPITWWAIPVTYNSSLPRGTVIIRQLGFAGGGIKGLFSSL